MRKIIISLFLLTVCSLFAFTKTTVAVITSSTAASAEVTSYLADSLTEALVSSSKYTVVDRNSLNMVMQELQLQHSDEFDESKATEIGKLLGAKLIFVVKISHIAEKYYVSIRGISTTTGEIAILKKYTVKKEKKFVKKAQTICRQFVMYANKYTVM